MRHDIFTLHGLTIEEAAVEAAAPGGAAVTPIADQIKALSPDQRRQWQLTGELPNEASKPDVTTESSTVEPEVDEPATSEAEEATGTVKTEPEPGPGDKGKQPKSPRTSWAELRERAARAEAERDLLKEQLAKPQTSPPATPEKKADADPRPKRPRLDESETVEEHEAKMDQHEIAVEAWRQRQIDSKFNSQSRAQTEAQRESTFAQQIESERKTVKDFDAVAFNKSVPASDVMIRKVKEHPQGAKILYHLGKNPELAKKLTEISDIPHWDTLVKDQPIRAAYEIGRVEALVDAEYSKIADSFTKPAAPTTTKSALPKPSGEVAVSGKGTAIEDPVDDAVKRKDFETFKREANKRELQGAGR